MLDHHGVTATATTVQLRLDSTMSYPALHYALPTVFWSLTLCPIRSANIIVDHIVFTGFLSSVQLSHRFGGSLAQLFTPHLKA